MATDSRVGTTIAGYRIESVLGRGGMGVVYLAEQVALGRKVALKVLAPELAGDPKFRERFLRESRLAASIEDPNILPVHEAGESGGALFIAMRYVRGTDLRRLIDEEGPLPPDRVVSVLTQVASALDAAHAEGLIHRDVKPGNVLVVPGTPDKVYLADFGLTRRASSDSGLTGTGQFVGTLDYAAPEQFTGEPLTPRTDVYSLGCVAYECLVGEPPFPRDREAAVLHAHLHEPPPRPTAKRPELPEAIDAVVAKAMAKKPKERYARAGELAAAVGLVVHERTGTAVRRLRGRLVLVGMLALVAISLGSGLILANRGSNRQGIHTSSSHGSHSVGPRLPLNSIVRVDPVSLRIVPVARGITGRPNRNPAMTTGEGSVWLYYLPTLWRVDESTGVATSTAAGEAPLTIAVGYRTVWLSGVATSGGGGSSKMAARFDPSTLLKLKAFGPFSSSIYALAVGEGALWAGLSDGNLARIDGRTGKFREIPLGNSVDLVAVGLGSVWAVDRLGGTCYRVDSHDTGSVAKIPMRGGLDDIAVGEGAAWLLDKASGTVTPIDADSNTPGSLIRVGTDPSDIAAGLGAVWVTDQTEGVIYRIDPLTHAKSRIRIGVPLAAVAVDTSGGAVWVAVEAHPHPL
jgi:serine/threonine protein kinase